VHRETDGEKQKAKAKNVVVSAGVAESTSINKDDMEKLNEMRKRLLDLRSRVEGIKENQEKEKISHTAELFKESVKKPTGIVITRQKVWNVSYKLPSYVKLQAQLKKYKSELAVNQKWKSQFEEFSLVNGQLSKITKKLEEQREKLSNVTNIIKSKFKKANNTIHKKYQKLKKAKEEFYQKKGEFYDRKREIYKDIKEKSKQAHKLNRMEYNVNKYMQRKQEEHDNYKKQTEEYFREKAEFEKWGDS
jgi:hypothetical protein